MKKLPSGSYRIQKMINGKRYSLTFKSKPTQKEIEYEVAKILNGSVSLNNAPRKTFEECADKYFDVKKNVLSASTYRSDRSRARNLSEEFRKTIMSDMDSLTVQKEINEIAGRLSPKSVRNYYTVIKNVIEMFIPELVLKVAVPKRSTKKELYIPTSDEVKKILDVSSEKYWIMFMLAAYGLRRSESTALQWPDDFDIENSIVHINKAKVYTFDNEWIIQSFNKTDASTRDVPISKELIDRIAAQGYVYNGHPRKIIEYLHTKQKQLNIPEFRLHDFRHYFATELDQARFSSKDVQKLGGWSSDAILKTIYQHSRVDHDKAIQQKAMETIQSKLI